ncbi:MAG: class I SAM-dependent methyltransferase [Microcoleaceae cyanobacterium]
MTVTTTPSKDWASQLVNGVLAVKPLANLAKHQARQMMIKRAEKMGVPWRQQANSLLSRNWDAEWAQIYNDDLIYPEYYCSSFHAYETGNLSWQAAAEVEVAAYAVHSKIWPEAGVEGDTRLRQSYHDVLQAQLSNAPQTIVDLGCGVGMSSFALQDLYPEASITGIDLSPYFLAIALYRSQNRSHPAPVWLHRAAESTELPDASVDLVSLCLVCHELPQTATRKIFQEARRILRPGGHLAIMDMNPQSEVMKRIPPYVLTLLKSTEPYLDQYFSLDIKQAIKAAGFQTPTVTNNSPRHRTIIAIA